VDYVNALLKPAEVQALLGVSRAWVYAAAQDGRLPPATRQ
jgi:predicted DNA-binding transcriptional regulator AlpA